MWGCLPKFSVLLVRKFWVLSGLIISYFSLVLRLASRYIFLNVSIMSPICWAYISVKLSEFVFTCYFLTFVWFFVSMGKCSVACPGSCLSFASSLWIRFFVPLLPYVNCLYCLNGSFVEGFVFVRYGYSLPCYDSVFCPLYSYYLWLGYQLFLVVICCTNLLVDCYCIHCVS